MFFNKTRIITKFLVKQQLQWIPSPTVASLKLHNSILHWVTKYTGLCCIIGTSSQGMRRICQVEGERTPLVLRAGKNAFHHWLVGHGTKHHSRDLVPRPRAALCQIIPWETLFVCVREHEREEKKLTSKLGCVWRRPRSVNQRGRWAGKFRGEQI